MTAVLLAAGVILLLVLRTNVIVSLCVPTIAYFIFAGIPLSIFLQRAVAGVDQFPLVAIPLFVLAGTILQSTGQLDGLADGIRFFAGRHLSAIPLTNVVGTTLFSGINGSAAADVAAIGPVMIPMMVKAGFSPAYAAALTASTSIVGPIIPPSIVFIFYSTLMHVPVTGLFLAGIGPGLLLSATFGVLVLVQQTDHPKQMADVPQIGVLKAATGIARPMLVAATILVCIVFGLATPTETAAIACVLALVISVSFDALRSVRALPRAFVEAGRTSAQVLLLIAATSPLAWTMALVGGPSQLVQLAGHNHMSAIGAILTINLLLLLLGALLDTFPALVIAAPVIAPLAVTAGIDPLQLGVMATLNLMLGAIHPPVGVCLYLSAKIANVSVWTAFRHTIPFLVAAIFVLALVSFFPALSLEIPTLLGGK